MSEEGKAGTIGVFVGSYGGAMSMTVVNPAMWYWYLLGATGGIVLWFGVYYCILKRIEARDSGR